MCGSGATSGAAGGAAQGALIGSVVPGVGTAVGAAVGGGIGLLSGMAGDKSADAQAAIAAAQEAEQRRTQALAISAAEPSARELAQMQQSIDLNTQDIARKQKLIDSSDPALIEAGKQALQLLQGKESGALAPLRAQQAKDKAALHEKLQAQLGTGYANTTAGIQALAAFDQAAQATNYGAQQSTLAGLLGTAERTAGSYGMQNNIGNASTLATMYGNQGNRMVNAITGNKVDTAGSAYAGDLARGQQQQATFNSLLNTGATLAAAKIGAKGTA